MNRRHGTLVLASAAVLAGMGLSPATAGATAPATAGAAALATAGAAAAPPVITISSSTTGTSLTDSSLGLSFEASDLALPGFTGGNLAAYLKTLGQSVIRIGGNTVDETFWTSTGAPPPSWSIATITPADLTALANLAQASGWKVILGVNLKHYNPSSAGDEAKFAHSALGSSLRAIEIGNEPDLYSQYQNKAAQFFTDFQAYVSAIEQAVPGLPIEGDDSLAGPASSFQNAFVSAESGLAKPDIMELTSHNYPLTSTTCGGSPTIPALLGTSARDEENNTAREFASLAGTLRLPAVLDEGNSVVCEGQQGVSDVYAAALWEVDDQLVTAREGVQGDYMHGTVLQCDTAKPLFMFYTPLCAPNAADAANGILAAQPEYYGLAAVHEIGTGAFLNLSNPDWANVRAYAILHQDNTVTVVLDDIQDPASNGPQPLQLDFGRSFTHGSRFNLAASSLTATSGITLGGQTVQGNGTLAPPVSTPVTVSGSTLTVTVAAGSTAIITLR
ncbi:MAG TPA: glycosyl hydrolase family 79 C-terminal domain-containing protein [Streptosporangiaceae bacterium]